MDGLGSELDDSKIHGVGDVTGTDDHLDQVIDIDFDRVEVCGWNPGVDSLFLSLLILSDEKLTMHCISNCVEVDGEKILLCDTTRGVVLWCTSGRLIVSYRPDTAPDGTPNHDFHFCGRCIRCNSRVRVEEHIKRDICLCSDGCQGGDIGRGRVVIRWPDGP